MWLNIALATSCHHHHALIAEDWNKKTTATPYLSYISYTSTVSYSNNWNPSPTGWVKSQSKTSHRPGTASDARMKYYVWECRNRRLWSSSPSFSQTKSLSIWQRGCDRKFCTVLISPMTSSDGTWKYEAKCNRQALYRLLHLAYDYTYCVSRARRHDYAYTRQKPSIKYCQRQSKLEKL